MHYTVSTDKFGSFTNTVQKNVNCFQQISSSITNGNVHLLLQYTCSNCERNGMFLFLNLSKYQIFIFFYTKREYYNTVLQ